jgi:hypothetical protein
MASLSLWPREHGAYGQVAFPLLTAFAVAGISAGGLLFAAAVVAGFLGHEAAAVLLGLRGVRARQDGRGAALRWFLACSAVAIGATLAALGAMAPAVRWSIAVPVVPAAALVAAMVHGREKSWYGEVAAALAFSGTALPVALAAGAPVTSALTVAIPFALLFVASTLAVRVVILRVRAGGNPGASSATRRAALVVSAGGLLGLGALAAAGTVPAAILVAALPGLLLAAGVALVPPAPTRLRSLGWTLVAVSVLTAVLVLVGV